MRLRIILASIVLTMASSAIAKDYHYTTVKGDPMHARIYTLDNGLKVYLSVNTEKPRIQTYIAVRTGSRNDPAETTGLAHYLEHLMFKGTTHFGSSDLKKEAPLLDSIQNRFEVYRTITDPAKRKAYYHQIDSISQVAAKYNIPNEYDKLMASLGSEGSNAYTSNDVTCYVENIPSNEVDNWAKVQGDRFQNMVIRGFHTELEAVYEEYNISLSNDGEKEYDALNAMIFPKHPYGTQTTIGTQEHLKNPSILNIKNYFKRYYVPNNVAICMAGDMNPDEVIATIDKYFGDWKKSDNLSRPEYAPVKNLTSAVDSTVIGLEAENLMLGWKANKASDLQCDTLDVISSILYNGHAGMFDLNLNQNMKVQYAAAGFENLNDYSEFLLQGAPKEGQKLEDVRALMLEQIEKLKKGEFSDDLIPSVINNMKLSYYTSLQNNKDRADKFVNSFINGIDWKDEVERLDRISKLTKKDIVAFANKFFGNNYACVYKRIGEDKNQKKIDKPQITAIPTNRDKSSQFLRDVTSSEVNPIQPKFLDYKKDLTFGKTSNGLPVIMKQNAEDKLFDLQMRYEFGNEADTRYSYAANYLDLLGTNKISAEQIKQQFYKLACNFGINVSDKNITVSLNGLAENMPQAIALAENVLKNAKTDKAAWKNFVAMVLKNREDTKKEQKSNFNAVKAYGIYGTYNNVLNDLSAEQLQNTNPADMVALIKKLSTYKHTVLYYGPATEKQLNTLISKEHKIATKLADVPVNKPYMEQQTPKNEILLAPYDAKNIYMTMYHNEGKMFNPAEAPVAAVFNEYFGGGMNTVVFQELREARGLAYSARAYYYNMPIKNHPQYGTTYIISQSDKMMDCIRVFKEILDTIPQNEANFNLAKQSLQKQLASMRVTKMNIINSYINAKERGLDYDINRSIYNALPSITLNDIVNYEKQNMANKPYRYIILGDEKNLNMNALEKIAPIQRISTKDIFGY